MEEIRTHRAPKTLVTGVGAAARIGVAARQLGVTKALVLTDAGLAASGLVEQVERPLAEAGLPVDVYDGAVPEPPIGTIAEAVAKVEAGGYDCVVGFGGGSAIDVAKLAAVLAGSGRSAEDLVGVDRAPRKAAAVLAVPTTAGTGSEVTAVAVLTNEKLNVRQGCVSPNLVPNVAVVDPLLTMTCPPGLTASAGIDAFIHNVEAYISENASLHTDPLARQGIELISRSLRVAVFQGNNVEARHNMAMGSLLGGLAYGNAGVGAVHALSYPLGGRYHLQHGVANGLMLPWVMEYNIPACLDYFWEIGEAMGEPLRDLSRREGAFKALEAMRQLVADIGLPQYLSDVGIPESAVEELADGAMTQGRLLANNPRQLTRDEVVQIYRNAAVRPGA